MHYIVDMYSIGIHNREMKLHAYLEKNGIKPTQFANDVKVGKDAVYKWLSGDKRPTEENLIKIATVTKGQVTANDFYDIPVSIVNIY
jgi:DNA-binding transcriptional regulator YiaG